MPRFDKDEAFVTASNYGYSAVRLGELSESEYTVVTIVVDTTPSVDPFVHDLNEARKNIISACNDGPSPETLLVRCVEFNSQDGVQEVHGFKEFSKIDPALYDVPKTNGLTNLYDVSHEVISTEVDFCERLHEQEFEVNGVVYIVTDGMDNRSRYTPANIRELVSKARQSEKLDSLLIVLIGINATDCRSYLENYAQEAGLDGYVDFGDASPSSLSKLAKWVSQSISQSTQARGSGQSVGLSI